MAAFKKNEMDFWHVLPGKMTKIYSLKIWNKKKQTTHKNYTALLADYFE